MTISSALAGFDGLMTLSRREGIDVRPTLLRVLTDLYVQASAHTPEEERQFVELASRLIDHVDDATRAAVRARLSIYPRTPRVLLQQLMVQSSRPVAGRVETARPNPSPADPQPRAATPLKMQPDHAADVSAMFFAAGRAERALILGNLFATPLKPAARILHARAARAIAALETAAFAADVDAFARELSAALMLPAAITTAIVEDMGREPLACALKALGMPAAIFQRVLLFLDPTFGSSVENVYRLSRFYDVLSERASLIMLAAWRGAGGAATRAAYRSTLYDDERSRTRSATPQARPATQPGAIAAPKFSRGS